MRLLRPGGVVAFNNPLAAPDGIGPGGDAVSDEATFGDSGLEDTADVTEQVRTDERLVPLLVPLEGGLLAAVKRED